jgi:hypothetical protein
MTGRALIRDRRSGTRYLASVADADGRTITSRARLLHNTLVGEHIYPERWRTMPLAAVEVRWLDDDHQGLAA